jgi:hypothetical protein
VPSKSPGISRLPEPDVPGDRGRASAREAERDQVKRFTPNIFDGAGRERQVLVERSVDPKIIDGSLLWIAMDSRAAPVRLSSYVAVVPLPALPSLTRRGTGLRTRGTPMLASTDLADPPA